ncbi:MAG: hypothetical protein V3U86_08080, partial [Acidobacteriota bacterium]
MAQHPRNRLMAVRVCVLGLAMMNASVGSSLGSTAMHQVDRMNQAMVDRGKQALVMCNGLFVSNRTLEQVYNQELKVDGIPVVP